MVKNKMMRYLLLCFSIFLFAGCTKDASNNGDDNPGSTTTDNSGTIEFKIDGKQYRYSPFPDISKGAAYTAHSGFADNSYYIQINAFDSTGFTLSASVLSDKKFVPGVTANVNVDSAYFAKNYLAGNKNYTILTFDFSDIDGYPSDREYSFDMFEGTDNLRINISKIQGGKIYATFSGKIGLYTGPYGEDESGTSMLTDGKFNGIKFE